MVAWKLMKKSVTFVIACTLNCPRVEVENPEAIHYVSPARLSSFSDTVLCMTWNVPVESYRSRFRRLVK